MSGPTGSGTYPVSCGLLQLQRHWGVYKSFSRAAFAATFEGGDIMKNPFDSLWGTIICGVLLTAVLYFVVKNILIQGS
jgi:hypothetical protein